MSRGNLKQGNKGPDKVNTAFYIENDIYVNPVDTSAVDCVFSPKYGYLKLDRSFLLSGGEGICCRAENNLFCKLYHTKHITYVNFKKLQLMLEMDIDNPFIVWPKDALYVEGNFAGYVMNEIKDAVSLDELRDKGFAGYNNLSRLKICLNFLKLIDYLHRRNILVGDMKLDNILIKPPCEVYIIDTGSFQIEDYSCSVYHREYSGKAYKGDELKKNLRTIEDEFFPVNKIIFEVLMLKSPYYNEENIEIDVESSQNFTYSVKPPNAPMDILPFHLRMWQLLPERMRKFFYDYFKNGKITPLSEWIMELESFIATR